MTQCDMVRCSVWRNIPPSWLSKPVYLSQEIEGDPGKDDIGEILDNTERSIDHPVGQPLCVIILVFRVNGLAAGERKIGITRVRRSQVSVS